MEHERVTHCLFKASKICDMCGRCTWQAAATALTCQHVLTAPIAKKGSSFGRAGRCCAGQGMCTRTVWPSTLAGPCFRATGPVVASTLTSATSHTLVKAGTYMECAGRCGQRS